MKQHEILKADLLDILFEHRNKDYGAYALRRNYSQRLLIALGGGLSMAALLLLTAMNGPEEKQLTKQPVREEMLIRELVLQPKKPELPKEKIVAVKPKEQKKTVQTAKAKYVNQFDIKKDELVKTTVNSVESLKDKEIGETDIAGKPAEAIVKVPEAITNGHGNSGPNPGEKPVNFEAVEKGAEFPGGLQALHRYLANNLRTPDDLESGAKKLVKVRFRVESDGSVLDFEIMESGGKEYDNEVLRVCKKMPRWTPAFQNGINVPVSFMIPVTFLGTE
jgi:periplasmic protein TonB